MKNREEDFNNPQRNPGQQQPSQPGRETGKEQKPGQQNPQRTPGQGGNMPSGGQGGSVE